MIKIKKIMNIASMIKNSFLKIKCINISEIMKLNNNWNCKFLFWKNNKFKNKS